VTGEPVATGEIYWVVGLGQNVGKTTMAAALIRVLNRAGRPAIGFKPFAAGLLRDLVDFALEHYPTDRCAVFGQDALQLARASPLTPAGSEDLVGPAQLLCFPDWGSVLLARTGSAALGNVTFFANAGLARFLGRPDIAQLAARMGIPAASAVRRTGIRLGEVLALAPDAQPAAWGRLAGRGASAMVCEGAGHYLPVWRGSPRVDHLFLLTGSAVLLYPGLRLDLSCGPGLSLRTVEDLAPALQAAADARLAAPHVVAPAARREALAEQIVENLLDRAGLIARRAAAGGPAQPGG
jgi:hypothetical protein